MATDDAEFYRSRQFTPESYEPPRQHGCFFYGCLISGVMALLLVVAVGVGFYLLYRALGRFVEEYTATAPRELPRVEMPPERRRSLEERFEAFRRALDAGTPAEPLVLTGDDVNALIEDKTELKGKLYVTIEGGKMKGRISLPLTDLINVPLTRGRYLNGEAELKPSLSHGLLLITLESITEVNGKRPPEDVMVMANLRQKNLAEIAYKEPENAPWIRNLESIEIKDGRIIVKGRPQGAGAPGALKDLPDDVWAPPDSGQPQEKPSRTGAMKGEEPAKRL